VNFVNSNINTNAHIKLGVSFHKTIITTHISESSDATETTPHCHGKLGGFFVWNSAFRWIMSQGQSARVSLPA
jgi:hypothetical protein